MAKTPMPQIEGKRVSVRTALTLWISYLQQLSNPGPDFPVIMVRGYDGDDKNWTEIDYENDDPTNLIDGTWDAPYFHYQSPEAAAYVAPYNPKLDMRIPFIVSSLKTIPAKGQSYLKRQLKRLGLEIIKNER